MTERMAKVLQLLYDWDASLTCAAIAQGIGIYRGPVRHGNGAAGRGGWAGRMSPAQHVIGTVRALEAKGLVAYGPRPDRRSGTAYRITDEGRDALEELLTTRVVRPGESREVPL